MSISYNASELAKRRYLADLLPLDKPFTVELTTSGICNFRCEFCPQSLEEGRKSYRNKGNRGFLDYQFLQYIVDDIKKSFGQLKQIVLTGHGEPLLNPRISDIVAYIADSGVCERITLITNGSCLTPKMCDDLVRAGLSLLRISVNGLSDEDFLKYSGTKVDFQKYVDSIRYLYTHKEQMSIYIKIINYMVDTQERQEKFFDIFSPICDVINIENLVQMTDSIDFHKLTKDAEKLLYTKDSTEKLETEICSKPFYSISIDEDGFVWPCCNAFNYGAAMPVCFGNLNKNSLAEIWNQKVCSFQRAMLDGARHISGCDVCSYIFSINHPEDLLDAAADQLKPLYDAKLNG